VFVYWNFQYICNVLFTHMKKKKSTDSDNLIITELMLIKADWQRTFVAEICRQITSEGVSIVRGTVVVNEGKIWCSAETQDELGKYLDDICKMKLDMELHHYYGVTLTICENKFNLN
jgi:hypothetical protein